MTNDDKYEILVRLTHAVFDLEDAIASAKQTLESKPSYPEHAMVRLNHYQNIVHQQKLAFPVITKLIRDSRYAELSLEVRRVNALSELIREDAKELLTVLANPTAPLDRPEYN